MKLAKYLFRSRLAFQPIDPLGDGLGDLIRAEQIEQGAITNLDEEPDNRFWDDMDMHEA